MYNNVSNKFKTAINSNSVMTIAKLTYVDTNIAMPQKYLKKVALKDYCNDDGKIIGTTMCKELEIRISNRVNQDDIVGKEVSFEAGVFTEDNEFEYIPYGNYIMTKPENDEANRVLKILAYDYMHKFDEDYKDTNTYPLTIWQYYVNLCAYYNVEVVDQEEELPNTDFIVTQAPVFEGTSGRIILSRIAEIFGSFAKVNRNNKMQMYLKTTTNEKVHVADCNTTLKINKYNNVIDTVVLELGGGVEGENISKTSNTIARKTFLDIDVETGILKQKKVTVEKRTLRITDNPFIYSQALKEQVINGIFDRVNGFSYVPCEFKYKGRFYFDCGDSIELEDRDTGEYHDTIIMNQYLEIGSTRQSTVKSEALTLAEVKYKYETKDKQKDRHTELLVNKIEGQIASLIDEVDDVSERTSTIEQEVDTISIKVEDLEDLTREVTGINPITLENCKAGNLLELHIRGNNSVFYHQHPRKGLHPSKGLHPYKGSSILEVNNDDLRNELLCTTTLWYYAIDMISPHPVIRHNACRTAFMSAEPNSTYRITKQAGGRFAIASSTISNIDQMSSGLIPTTYVSDENEGQGLTELTISTGEDDHSILIFLYDSNVDTVDAWTLLSTVHIQKDYAAYDLNVINTLKQSGEYYDEYVIKDGYGYELRRILDNGVIATNPQPINKVAMEIPLREGTNTIDIVNYIATITAKYVVKNDLTNFFATQIDLSSQIEVKANEIKLSVIEEVTDENYLKRATIESSIDLGILDDQGYIHMKTNKFSWSSDFSSLTEEGELTVTKGNIAGWDINSNSLTKGLAGIVAEEEVMAFTEVFYVGKGLGEDGNDAWSVNTMGYMRGHAIDLYCLDNNQRYPSYIKIYAANSQTGTVIESDNISTGHGIFGDGIARGYAMHSPDLDKYSSNNHTYWCHFNTPRK